MSAKQARRAGRGGGRGGRAAADEERGESLGESLRTIGLALLLALVIRTFVFQTFYVPSGSMFPTLLIGDHVFVNKFLYGIAVPLTDGRLPGLREPLRGDVVVFRAAREPGGAVVAADRAPDLPREDFIKRIVGVPGDLLEVRHGRVYVDGEPLERDSAGEIFLDPQGRRLLVADERVERCVYSVLDDPVRPDVDRPPTRIEPGRYFVMGDNRDDSYDSRFFGTVRLREIEGPAGLLYWSWDFNGSWLSLLNPLTWWDNITARTRWGRLGSSVSCG
jgi:signal peptidase I